MVQVELIDMIGISDMKILLKKIKELAAVRKESIGEPIIM
jgi:tetrahydromethanopterin S-methyltransferase subunit A